MAPMTRLHRSLLPLALGLLGASVLLGCSGPNPYQAAASSTTTVTVTTTAVEPGAVTGNSLADNVFTPDANISSCVGTLERPDCGTKTKGGWHMTLVFTALIGGLAFVFWRVGRGVRQRDAVVNRVADEPTAATTTADAEASTPDHVDQMSGPPPAVE